MNRRSIRTAFGVVLALGGAALFIRLGFWQLHRLAERRAYNAQLARRLSDAPVPLDSLPADSALAKYRRVEVTGTFDYDHEIVLTGRSRDGSPGVYLITPLRPDSGGPAVLVNRGWVYSPDAFDVPEPSRWREPEHTTVNGYIDPLQPRPLRDPRSPTHPRSWRALDATRLPAAFPYPIRPYYIADLGNAKAPGAPVRMTFPTMDEGPHMSYAIQWFSFAAIAIVGMVILLRQERRGTRTVGVADRAPPVHHG